MADLESLVRPFQSGERTPSRTYYNYGQRTVPKINLRIGRGGGGGKVVNGSVNITVTSYCERYENEKDQDIS